LPYEGLISAFTVFYINKRRLSNKLSQVRQNTTGVNDSNNDDDDDDDNNNNNNLIHSTAKILMIKETEMLQN